MTLLCLEWLRMTRFRTKCISGNQDDLNKRPNYCISVLGKDWTKSQLTKREGRVHLAVTYTRQTMHIYGQFNLVAMSLDCVKKQGNRRPRHQTQSHFAESNSANHCTSLKIMCNSNTHIYTCAPATNSNIMPQFLMLPLCSYCIVDSANSRNGVAVLKNCAH